MNIHLIVEIYGWGGIIWGSWLIVYMTSHRKWEEAIKDIATKSEPYSGVERDIIKGFFLLIIMFVLVFTIIIWPINIPFFIRQRIRDRKEKETN